MITRRMWTQLLAVMTKELRQTVRDRRMMGVLIIAPLIQLVMFGFAVDFDVDDVPTVVVDLDGSAASRRHVRRLLADGTLRQAASVDEVDEAQAMLEDGRAAAAVVIPKGLDRDMARGQPTEVQVLLDGTDPNRAAVASGAVSRYFGEVGLEMARERLRRRDAALGVVTRLPGVEITPRVYYNPQLATAVYMVPGVSAMLLVMVTTIVTAMGLSREREMGTLEQVLVTPIPPGVLMVGKIVPFVGIGLIDLALAVVVGAYVFGMPIRGAMPVLGLATMLYLMSTLGVGLFISTVSNSQQQAFMGGFMFILPAILLSGNLTPIGSMPEWLQPFTYLNPVRYFVEIVRAHLLKGAGVADLWPQLAALAVGGVLIVTVASLRFRKQLA